MPKTARELNVKNPFDPENGDAGVRHLKHLLEKYNEDVNLTGYSPGQGAVRSSTSVARIAETRITCGGSRIVVTEGWIARNQARTAIPCMFNEMSGACFTSATRTRLEASVLEAVLQRGG